jgi:hypothetical protein
MGGTWGGWGGMGGVVMGGDGGGGGGGGGGWWFDQTPLKKRFAPKTTKISKKEVHQKTLKKCKIDTFFYLQTSVHMVSLYLPPPPHATHASSTAEFFSAPPPSDPAQMVECAQLNGVVRIPHPPPNASPDRDALPATVAHHARARI